MSPSRDIKALFDRFGGDPDSYREIRMESEAHEARGRWPLLGMIDPRKVGLSAVETPRAAAAPSEPEAEQAAPERYEGVQSSPVADGALLPRDRSQAALRRSAPLFTRSPRRDIPPVIEKSAPQAPESGAFRFSPLPAAGEQPDDAAQHDLGGAVTTPLQSREPRVAARAVPPLLPIPPVLPAVNAALAQGAAAQGVARTSPSASSPLKKLFGTAAPSMQGAAQAQDSEGGDRLDRLFDRLRAGGVNGGAARTVEPNPAAAPRQPWFPKGAGRP